MVVMDLSVCSCIKSNIIVLFLALYQSGDESSEEEEGEVDSEVEFPRRQR